MSRGGAAAAAATSEGNTRARAAAEDGKKEGKKERKRGERGEAQEYDAESCFFDHSILIIRFPELSRLLVEFLPIYNLTYVSGY